MRIARQASRGVAVLIGGGFAVHSVLLTTLLVVATAVAVGLAILQALGNEVQEAADRRLATGATFYQTLVEDRGDGLIAFAGRIAYDPLMLWAAQADGPVTLEEREFVVRVPLLREVAVANVRGDIMARIPSQATLGSTEALTRTFGFSEALAGRIGYEIIGGSEPFLRQVAYAPIFAYASDEVKGVLCAISFLDQQQLRNQRARIGHDITVYSREAGLVSSLDEEQAERMVFPGGDSFVYEEVVGEGREVTLWRALPSGRVRAHYFPLTEPDGSRLAMVVVSLPGSVLAGELLGATIPALPVTLLFILLGATLAYIVARRVRDPVLALAVAANRLAAGDLSTPVPPVKEPEVAQLAKQLELARTGMLGRLEAIAGAEARQRALFAVLREPILTTGADGRISDCNAAAGALLGSAESLLQRSIHDVLPFVSSPGSEDATRTVWTGAIADHSGRAIDVEVSQTTLVEGQLPTTRVYVVHDITQHTALTRLREQLLHNVAHELRNPLAVLANAVQILAADYAELSARELNYLLGAAGRTVTHLQALVENLLSAGSIQAGRFQVRPRPIELGLIVRSSLEITRPATDARRQRVSCALPDGPLCVLADERYARQALTNLLSNATKYSPEGAEIQLCAREVDGQVRISVQDRGPGIPTEQRASVFERFYRGPSAQDAPGIGLGLAIVKGIAEAHGGSVGLESEVGRGTTVWFTLPVEGAAR